MDMTLRFILMLSWHLFLGFLNGQLIFSILIAQHVFSWLVSATEGLLLFLEDFSLSLSYLGARMLILLYFSFGIHYQFNLLFTLVRNIKHNLPLCFLLYHN
jgi:hypothetical protein